VQQNNNISEDFTQTNNLQQGIHHAATTPTANESHKNSTIIISILGSPVFTEIGLFWLTFHGINGFKLQTP